MFGKKMKAQVPAEGISLMHDFGESKFFKIDCSCHNADDEILLMVEIQEDIQEVVLHFDTTAKTDWWKELATWETYKIDNSWLYSIVNGVKSLINGLYHRFKITKDVWLNGYVKYSSSTYMTKQQALNFAETIRRSIDELEKVKKEKNKKK